MGYPLHRTFDGSTWDDDVPWIGKSTIDCLGAQVLQNVPPVPPPTPVFSKAGFSNIQIIDHNIIKLMFPFDLSIDVDALSVTSYQISSVDGTPTVIQKVFADDKVTNFVLLQVSPPPQIGKIYKLTIVDSKLKSTAGGLLPASYVKWLHSLTKTDSIISKIPKMYNKALGSQLRIIAQAITISDEQISGQFLNWSGQLIR
jgi:hypothetical protein